jgi:tetratricopeptide (TPR) repeat protein
MDFPAASNPERSNQEKVETLLRDAHIQRMRGQTAAAETLCRKALELSPDDVMGQEMLGDLLTGKGELDEALTTYRAAFERQPEKASLEEKIARLVLMKGEEEHQKLAAMLMLESPAKESDAKRNATLATLLSMVCPGLGQLVIYRQYVKGGILAGVGLLGLALGGPDLFKLALAFSEARSRVDKPNDALAMLGLLAVLIWLYSLLDAAGGVKGKKKASDV